MDTSDWSVMKGVLSILLIVGEGRVDTSDWRRDNAGGL